MFHNLRKEFYGIMFDLCKEYYCFNHAVLCANVNTGHAAFVSTLYMFHH